MQKKRNRQFGSVKRELLAKSREAALCAIKTFNDPLVEFKSETYIVLMVIAWTYMLHAYYRSKGIEYRHYDDGKRRRKFHRTKKGAFKYWELERCLNDDKSPIDTATASNLRFLIGLRHEIEHQMTRKLDAFLSGRYHACAVNYNAYVKKLFGKKFALDDHLSYSIQFVELTEEQIGGPRPAREIPERLRAYIAEFDASLSDDELDDPRYALRFLFTRKTANRAGQADTVIEFVAPDSDLAKELNKQYVVLREVERPKFLAKNVVAAVRKAGFTRFRINPEHVRMWKSEDAKNPAKGYGSEVAGAWFWYERWIHRCIQLCEAAGDKYR